MSDPEVNADVMRNRLASFAPRPESGPANVSCPHCGATVVHDREFCPFCGAPCSPPADSTYRVASASPELTASQKAYDPYQNFVPPYAVPLAGNPGDIEEIEEAVEPGASDVSPKGAQGTEEPELTRRSYLRAVLAGLVVGVLGLAAMSGWHWRGQVREMWSEFDRRISSDLAAVKGSAGHLQPAKPAPPAATNTLRKRPGHPHLPNHSPQGGVAAVPANRAPEPATLRLTSETDRAAGSIRPALISAAISPMRVTITPRESLQLLMYTVPPVYSQLARERHLEGSVALKAIIGKDGTVQGLQVVSGNALLVPAAMEAVKQWRYRPYFLNGEPREVETTVVVDFSLAREHVDSR